ncbi:14-3-3 protein sigma [Tritrichomonas foetus]|uniref:14-3-3 protein sigma n=1 Tax=Tritrichomonas foetus TaxID=1144522 RepID=A0A1J4JJX0_9EUKA|nr:14-3-3 protein sigma [Tritrichomonas foetus]|eukprot:OHS97819.1 14-3-3 protein sigma [Tritrichomonas foetus]
MRSSRREASDLNSSRAKPDEIWASKFTVAKILEPMECNTHKLKLIRELIPANPTLNREQRNLFLSTYRSATLKKRNGLRILRAIAEQQRKSGKIDRAQKLEELKNILQVELFDLCTEVHMMIDKYLYPETMDANSNAFYLKMNADFYRYEYEFASEANQQELASKARECYLKAMHISKESLQRGSALSLSLSLNYSVFLYEVENQKKQAIDTAQNALDESGILVHDGNDDDYSEAATTQQLLRENITMWTRDEGE